jgi:hypothetical protein
MLVRHVALVSEVGSLTSRELTRVGAALQKQVTRDFAKLWKVRSTVSAFASLDDVPIDYWPVIIVEDVEGAAGVHLDEQGQPFALVEIGDEWSATASHETLEMLADPFGNRLVAGPSPKPGQGRVEFLVEVCDPSEAGDFGYTVNGVRVSDFYTPNYFDPESASGVRYSFTGAITAPRQVLKGGYLSWHDILSDEWYQERFFGNSREFVRLGKLTEAGASVRSSLRSLIDAKTPEGRVMVRKVGGERTTVLRTAGETSQAASGSKAKSWRRQIAALKASTRR